MPAVTGVTNNGVILRGLSTLPSATEMLTVDPTGLMGRQAIPVGAFGSLTGSPSDNPALAAALAGKVSLSGDTMTGPLNGTSAAFNATVAANMFDVPQNGSNQSLFRFSSGGVGRGALVFNPSRLEVGLRNDNYSSSGEYSAYVDGSGNFRLRNANVYNSSPVFTVSPAGATTQSNSLTLSYNSVTTSLANGAYANSGALVMGGSRPFIKGYMTICNPDGIGIKIYDNRLEPAASEGLNANDNSWDIGVAGYNRFRHLYMSGNVVAGSSSAFEHHQRTRMLSPSDGKLQITNNGGTSGVQLDFNTNGQMSIRDRTDSGAGNLNVGSITSGNINSSGSGTFANAVSAYWLFGNANRTFMFNHFNIAAGFGYTFSPTSSAGNGSEEFGWYRDAPYSVALSGGANALRLNLYGSYTDASNYRRLYLSSTTLGAFTLGVEGLGTGASGNTLSVGNKINLIAGGNSYAPDALSFGSSNRGFTAGSGSTDPIFVITSNGQAAAFSNSAFKLPSNRTIDWSGNSDNADSATQARIAMNAYGQIDTRGDLGFRSRNFANTGDAPVSGSTAAFSSTSSFTGLISANGGINVTGNIQPGDSTTGLRFGDAFSGDRMRLISSFATISGGFSQLRLEPSVSLAWASNVTTNSVDARFARGGTGLIDYYGNSGIRLFNYAGSDWSNLQGGRVSSRVYDTVSTDQSCIDLYNSANRSNINCGIMFRPGPPAHYVAHIQAFTDSVTNQLLSNSLNFRVARNTGTTTVSTATLHSIANMTAEGMTITPYSAAAGVTVSSAANVGIGQSNPSVGLVIRRSGTDLPALRLEDGDVTVPMTGLAINPSLNANTISSWSANSSTDGGSQMNGFCANNANAIPMSFLGYHGSASPVAPALAFRANKSNGGTGVSDLSGTELIAGFYAGNGAASPAVSVAANGTIAASSLSLSGALTHGFQPLVADPSTVDITNGLIRAVKNTTSGELRFWANDGNVMKSVLFS